MNNEDLIQEIRNAFSVEVYPGDENIVYDNSGTHLECEEVKSAFKSQEWQTLTTNFLIEQRYSLSFFSNEAFSYYLPAFLILVIDDFYKVDDLSDNLVLKMTLPTELDVAIMANAVKKYNVDKQMPGVDFDEILRVQLYYKNQDVHNFIARVSQFTTDQGKAIRHFLDYLKQEYQTEFTRGELDIAIERYWFLFE